MSQLREKFWEQPLAELNDAEWETLCDGCGRCCMRKFEDEDTGEILYTSVACRLFDDKSCRCTDYAQRFARVPDCLNIRAMTPEQMHWLPSTCAYRLRFDGKPLPEWHPLISGNPESVHEASVSMRELTTPEDEVPEDEVVDYIFASSAEEELDD